MRIQFVSFWNTFKAEEFGLTRILRTRWPDLEIVDSWPDLRVVSVFGEVRPSTVPSIFYSAEPFCGRQQQFDLSLTFDREEDERSIRLPNYAIQFDADEAEQMRRTAPGYESRFGCDYIYHHDQGPRLKAKSILSGSGLQIRTLAEHGAPGWRGKIPLQRCSRWSIAMEKIRQPGYVSEKLFHSIVAGAVPIYYGDLSVGLDVNEDAIIHVKEPERMEDLPIMLTRDRWEACRAAPLFPNGTAPVWWDRKRLLDAIEGILMTS